MSGRDHHHRHRPFRRWKGLAAVAVLSFSVPWGAERTYEASLSWSQADALQAVASGLISVVDGDTIRVAPYGPTRLVGFNAAESRHSTARCPAELASGRTAKVRLAELLMSGTLNLNLVTCSCAPGTVGTWKCNFGRACGRLAVDGHDVGTILIAERLAAPYVCGPTRCPARRSTLWCGPV